MNKKIIAIVLASIGSSVAMAESSNVVVYGQASAAFESVNVSDGGQRTSRVQDQASRIGFKGTEDLGSGLKAIWQIETGLDISGDKNGEGISGANDYSNAVSNAGNTGRIGNRNTFVGLNGNFGTVILGRHDTPYKISSQKLNHFAGTSADYSAIVGDSIKRFDLRANNVVAYIAPKYEGFSGALAYVANEAKSATFNPYAWSLNINYENGPFYVAYAHERHNDFLTQQTAANPGGVSSLANEVAEHANKISFNYTYAPDSSVGVLFERLDMHNGTAAAISTSSAGSVPALGDWKRNAWGISAKHRINQYDLKAQWFDARDASTNVGSLDNTGSRFYALGVDYNMSKRTALFAQYAHVQNEQNAARNIFSPASAPNMALGRDISALGLGMRHSF